MRVWIVMMVGLLLHNATIYAQGGHVIDLNTETVVDDSVTAVHSKIETRAKALGDTLTSIHTHLVNEIETDVHAKIKWFGRHATQAGTVWALQDTLGLFRSTSGANTWGIDAADTTKIFGSTNFTTDFDISYILIVANSATTVYKVRFVWSTTNFAAGLAAGNITETMSIPPAANARSAPMQVGMVELTSGTKVWAQA